MRAEHGQAAADLVAVIPVLLGVLLALAQLAIAGYALWTAGDAARAGARAAYVGDDAADAARDALPRWLEHHAEIDPGVPVSVTLRAPALLPGLPGIPVSAAAGLAAEEPSGG
jgi:hypothetical protein